MRTGYILAIIFILGWWTLAFMPKPATHLTSTVQISQDNSSVASNVDPALSALNRDAIISALAGDFKQISRLLLEWDMDAQLLQHRGVKNIERLPQNKLLTALDLIYQLQTENEPAITLLRNEYRKPFVLDDCQQRFDCKPSTPKILPHTIATASFVFALNGTDNVIAIPKAIREKQPYFPDVQLDTIAYDCDRSHGEAIAALKPDIAFVASYSNPASLEALRRQEVKAFTLSDLNTKEDIINAIERVGAVINRDLEAFILTTFIDAAFLCIDNRIAALKEQKPPFEKPLVTYYYGQWYFPTYKTLTSRLAERAGIPYSMKTLFDSTQSIMWLQPVTSEQLVFYNPSDLIVAADNHSSLHLDHLLRLPFFSEIDACQHAKVQMIDAEIQQSVSQHIVLAYFDLYYSLVQLSMSCPTKSTKSTLLTSASAY